MARQVRRGGKRGRGFLVVCVGAVAAVLVAAALAVGEQRAAVTCRGNLRELWRAATMYEQDHGTLPLTYYHLGVFANEPEPERAPNPPPSYTFVDCLGPYVTDKSTLVCPDFHPGRGTDLIGAELNDGTTYMFNSGASGLRLAQVKVRPEQAPLFFDLPFFPPHWGRYNWVFLDGHVALRPNIAGCSYPLWHEQTWPDF